MLSALFCAITMFPDVRIAASTVFMLRIQSVRGVLPPV
jgi:hypothetical protein